MFELSASLFKGCEDDFARALCGSTPPGQVTAGATAARILTVVELEQVERANLLLALETCGWWVSRENGAARLLNINPSTLASRVKALGLRRPHAADRSAHPRSQLERRLVPAGRSTKEIHYA